MADGDDRECHFTMVEENFEINQSELAFNNLHLLVRVYTLFSLLEI